MIFCRFPNKIFSTVLHSTIKGNKFMKSSEPPNRDGSDQNNIESKLEISKDQNLQMMVKAILQERRFYKQIEQQRLRKEQEERRQKQAKEQQRLRKEQQRQAKEQQRLRKEQQRLRKEQEERRQRQAKEEQRLRKEQQRLRKEQEKTKKAQKLKFIITSIISVSSLSLAVAHYFFDFDPIERSRQNNMVKKCFNFPSEQNNYIDSPLYSQAKKAIQLPFQGRIKLAGGSSGIGKTTVVKRILKDMQKQGEQTYYFSFGEFNKDQEQERLKKQFYLFIRGLKRKYKHENRAKIIFDDINRVEAYPQEFKLIMSDIYRLTPYPNLSVTCISSSGSFIANQINHKYWGALFKKMGKAIILQDFLFDNEDMKKFHIEIIKMKFKNKYKDSQKMLAFEQNKIAQKIADMRITTRDIVTTFQDCMEQLKKLDFSKKENFEKIFQYFKLKQIDQVEKLNKLITQSKPDSLKLETYASLLKIMNSLKKKELDFNTCGKILKKVKNDQYKIAAHALDVLEENNLIILCRPRSETEAQAFNKFIEQHQNKKKIWNFY